MKRFSLVLMVMAAAAAPAWSPVAAQDAQPKEDPRLAAIGGLGASTTYVSFAYVGVTSDAFEKGVYDAARVTTLMTEVQNLMKVNSQQLDALPRAQLIENDAKALDEIKAVMGMNAEYAKLLIEYTKTKDADAAKAFQKQRTETWERLKKLLGLK